MIKKGDKVKIKEGYYKAVNNREMTYTVDSKPFRICNILSVYLKELKGIFAVETLEEIKGGSE